MRWENLKKVDTLWCLFTAALGEGCFLIGSELSSRHALIGGHVGLFIAGAVVGYLKPDRVWRWGISSVLVFPIADFIGVKADHSLSSSWLDSLVYVLVKVPVYLVQSLPAFAGAYLSGWLRGGVRVSGLRVRSVWVPAVGFLLGLVVGVIPLVVGLFLGVRNPFVEPLSRVWWIAGFILLGGVMSFIHPHWRWRVGVVVGLGFPSAAMFMIVTEVFLDLAKHNLWPFTLLFTLVFGIALSFLGACLGTLLNGILQKRAREKKETVSA
jgi:hypothetical protein